MLSRKNRGKLLRQLRDYGIITIAMLLGVIGVNLFLLPNGHCLNSILGHRHPNAKHILCAQCRAPYRSTQSIGMALLCQNHLCRNSLHRRLHRVTEFYATKPPSACRPKVYGVHGGSSIPWLQHWLSSLYWRLHRRLRRSRCHGPQIP